MGANFQTMMISGGTTRSEVKTLFEKAQDDDRYENGHSYSGGFGMARGLAFPSTTFETGAEARTWLEENCQKWESAQAVTFKDDTGASHWMIGAWCAS